MDLRILIAISGVLLVLIFAISTFSHDFDNGIAAVISGIIGVVFGWLSGPEWNKKKRTLSAILGAIIGFFIHLVVMIGLIIWSM